MSPSAERANRVAGVQTKGQQVFFQSVSSHRKNPSEGSKDSRLRRIGGAIGTGDDGFYTSAQNPLPSSTGQMKTTEQQKLNLIQQVNVRQVTGQRIDMLDTDLMGDVPVGASTVKRDDPRPSKDFASRQQRSKSPAKSQTLVV